MTTMDTQAGATVSVHAGWWRRRLVEPAKTLLTQGTSPRMLARTVGIGVACGIFPFLGATTALTFAVGLALRMNQPVLQMINQVLGPVQLVLIPVFVRAGEWIWSGGEERFSVEAMLRVAREADTAEFLARFGRAGLHAFSAWLLAAPVVFILVDFFLQPLLARLARNARAADARP